MMLNNPMISKAGGALAPIQWKSTPFGTSTDDNWNMLTNGLGKTVSVLYNSNKAAYTEDGITWRFSTMPSTAYWKPPVYGKGKFVTIAVESNKAAYSTDGINWTASTLPSSDEWEDLYYGGGVFVAHVRYSTKAAYSTDGVTWTAATMPVISSGNFEFLFSYGRGKFVAVTSAGKALYSTDGVTWTAVNFPQMAQLGIVYAEGIFIATGNGGKAAYSRDGVTWASTTMPSSDTWITPVYGNGKFVSVPLFGDDTAGAISAYSTDGETWIGQDFDISQDTWYGETPTYWNCLIYQGGKFVALTFRDDVTMSSVDGVNWKGSKLPNIAGTGANYSGLGYLKGKYIALASYSTSAYYGQ